MQQAKAVKKTNSAIASRYAEEERRRREGKLASKKLADEAESARKDRQRAARDDTDTAREFALATGSDSQELRQGLQIETDAEGPPNAEG